MSSVNARTRRFIGPLLLAAGAHGMCVVSAVAQVFAPGPASIGVGRGGPAYVYGPEALFLNPANIAFGVRDAVEVSTGRATVGVGGNLLQFRFYNEVFTSGQTITDDETRTVLSEWFGGADSGLQRSASVSAEAVPLAIIHSLGSASIAYSIRMRNRSSVSLNGGWLDLLLTGTETSRAIPLNGQFGLMSTTEFGVTYARKLPGTLVVGATPKIVFGNDFVDARLESTATVTETAVTHDFDYVVRAAGGLSADVVDHVDLFSGQPFGGGTLTPSILSMAGLGLGLDAGVSMTTSPSVRISASITDLGFVRWSQSAQTIRPMSTSFTFDGLVLDIDRVRDEYGGDVAEFFRATVDSLATEAYKDEDRRYGSFSAALPTTLHLGAAWTPNDGRTIVAGGTSAPFFASAIRPSTLPDVHVGIQHELGSSSARFPLRAGVLLGGSTAMTLSAGFGVHTSRFDFDMGVAGTPRSDIIGGGARYMAAVSAVTIRI